MYEEDVIGGCERVYEASWSTHKSYMVRNTWRRRVVERQAGFTRNKICNCLGVFLLLCHCIKLFTFSNVAWYVVMNLELSFLLSNVQYLVFRHVITAINFSIFLVKGGFLWFFSKREVTFTFAICCRPSVICHLSVCNVHAPYSAGWNFWQCFYGIWYLGRPLASTENFTEIVPGTPPPGGGLNARG